MLLPLSPSDGELHPKLKLNPELLDPECSYPECSNIENP